MFGIGGYNTDNHLEPVKWLAMLDQTTTNYKFSLSGISMNNHALQGSTKWRIGFVDSGTTFSYLPKDLWDSLVFHFNDFCEKATLLNDQKYCQGGRFLTKSDGYTVNCFEFNETRFGNNTKEFFLGYPIINFHTQAVDGTIQKIQWFPSEYLYKEKDG